MSAATDMAKSPDAAAFSKSDRLGLALFGAALIHMLVILGVSFTMPKARDTAPNLEITLVQTRSDRAPADPQFLAQANQDGGGNSDRRDVARSPLPLQDLSPKNDAQLIARRPPPQPAEPAHRPLLTAPQSSERVAPIKPAPQRKAHTQPPSPGLLDRAQLDQERLRLTAEISREWQAYQQRPRLTFINARTQEYKYAAYMDAWRAKVERIGNLNYPEAARRQNLSGSLLLDVALKPDGSVASIRVERSSGYKVLDDAAVRIVELAAPFAPFPPDIRRDTDILHIVRTWKFREDSLHSEAQ